MLQQLKTIKRKTIDDDFFTMYKDAVRELHKYDLIGSVEEIVQKIHELEVYKRALELACLSIGEWEQVSATNEGQINYFLQEARKELEDEKNI